MSSFEVGREKLTRTILIAALERAKQKAPPVLSSWSSDGRAGCIDYTRQLRVALEREGIVMAEQQGSGHISLTDDIDRRDEEKLIADPSYSQFLKVYDPLSGMPPILTGTVKEVREFFRIQRENLAYDPDELVDDLYIKTIKPRYTEEDEEKLKKKYV